MNHATVPSLPIDPDEISIARIHNAALGGFHNFETDRALWREFATRYPELIHAVLASRLFLNRVVEWLAEQGIDQYLDFGSGIPNGGQVHQVARGARPEARVVYVDSDPTTAAHGASMLADDPLSVYLRGDVRHPERVLADPAAARLLDLRRPVAVLMIAVLQNVPDDADIRRAMSTLRHALAPGSLFVIAHWTDEGVANDHRGSDLPLIVGSPLNWTVRGRAAVSALFDGLELLPPGIVPSAGWSPPGEAAGPVSPPGMDVLLVGVGRVPSPVGASQE
jgi:SAM-dependent methyltransferase